jgi:hypothetical protein
MPGGTNHALLCILLIRFAADLFDHPSRQALAIIRAVIFLVGIAIQPLPQHVIETVGRK